MLNRDASAFMMISSLGPSTKTTTGAKKAIRCHRSPAADRRQGHLPETAAQGQADRAQAIHRRKWPGPAGNPGLAMEHTQMNTQDLIDTARALAGVSRCLAS